MGCGGSKEEAAPEELLADPAAGEDNTFYFKHKGMFSRDYTVYKDEAREAEKWLIVDCEGSLFDSSMDMTVENFKRPEGGGLGSGECLAHAELSKLTAERYRYYDGEVEKDSDDSDYSTDSDAGEEDVDVERTKKKTKWTCKAEVGFYTDKAKGSKVAKLTVKAKGKAKMTVNKIETEYEDGRKEKRVEVEKEAKVKKFFYGLELAEGGEEVPITLKGSWNKAERDELVWSCPGFKAQMMGFNSKTPVITVAAERGNPAMWLLVGFAASVQLAPDDVKKQCCPPFYYEHY